MYIWEKPLLCEVLFPVLADALVNSLTIETTEQYGVTEFSFYIKKVDQMFLHLVDFFLMIIHLYGKMMKW